MPDSENTTPQSRSQTDRRLHCAGCNVSFIPPPDRVETDGVTSCPRCSAPLIIEKDAPQKRICAEIDAEGVETPYIEGSARPPAIIGPYIIEEPIGTGDKGVIYRARDSRSGKSVAIKAIPLRAISRNMRFKESRQSAGKSLQNLDNPSIAGFLGSGEIGDLYYAAREMIAGENLRDRIRSAGRMPPADAATTIADIARALAAAHEKDIIHGGIKPENVFICADGKTVVTDFGFNRFLNADPSGAFPVGSPCFLSPEQLSGKEPDERSDIYSLGALFYFLLTGYPPFTGRTAEEIAAKHADNPAPSLARRAPDVPEAAAQIIRRCMAKNPLQRYQNCNELLKDIISVSPLSTPRRKRGGLTMFMLYLAVISGVTIIIGSLWLALRGDPAGKKGPFAVSGSARSLPDGLERKGNSLIRASDGAEMVHIPAGSFIMGDETGYDDARPRREVHLREYYIDRTEVTNSQYLLFLGATGRPAPAAMSDEKLNQPNQPVVGVTWHDAAAYCEWAVAVLPTEAQWERAAAGDESLPYPWGKEWNPDLCNWSGRIAESRLPLVVGSFQKGASPCGALDMCGNVAEWCRDWYAPKFYAIGPASNPAGPSQGRFKVVRGGHWKSGPVELKTTFRDSLSPDCSNHWTGFRCAIPDVPDSYYPVQAGADTY
ncbi:MAG TPA: bifunctional serine/threonine-protein kinase/formylglycine-generating enzyme family protein [Candidatus Brocadiia bacterium]|nr:bifunctional serine/threonine-protein kinase/formylglycine-generating enzyme family protein [Candidatus Brocadiia bacterium]